MFSLRSSPIVYIYVSFSDKVVVYGLNRIESGDPFRVTEFNAANLDADKLCIHSISLVYPDDQNILDIFSSCNNDPTVYRVYSGATSAESRVHSILKLNNTHPVLKVCSIGDEVTYLTGDDIFTVDVKDNFSMLVFPKVSLGYIASGDLDLVCLEDIGRMTVSGNGDDGLIIVDVIGSYMTNHGARYPTIKNDLGGASSLSSYDFFGRTVMSFEVEGQEGHYMPKDVPQFEIKTGSFIPKTQVFTAELSIGNGPSVQSFYQSVRVLA